MSDFIGHLLAQVHPPANALEPRAASRFETVWGGGDPWRIDVVEAAAPAPMPATPPTAPGLRTPESPAAQPTGEATVVPRARRHVAHPVAPADEPRAERPVDRISAAPASRAEPQSERVMVERVTHDRREIRTEVTRIAVEAQPPRPEEPTVRLPPRDLAMVPVDPPRTAEARRADEPHAEVPQAPEPLVPAATPPPLPAAPLEPQIMPEIAAPQAAEPMPATVIEVRIGRIEIHAPEVRAPSVAAPVPALAAGGSRLDRYLSRN